MYYVSPPNEIPTVFDCSLDAGDLDAVDALYDDQASTRAPGKGKASGRAAVHQEMRQLIGAKASIANRLRDVVIHGDTARINMDWTTVLRSDGGWKMIVANPCGNT
jgi:ketosteroid isomerase-like protein